MKRFIAYVITITTILTLVACGASNKESSSMSGTNNNLSTPDNTNIQEENGNKDNNETTASTEGNLGDYYVKVKDAFLTENYSHDNVIVITYEWTNNSDETTGNWLSVIETAFQDGIELESAYMIEDERYDSSSSQTEVRPGTTLDIQCAYILRNTESKVEFEIEELMSWNDDLVYAEFDPTTLS